MLTPVMARVAAALVALLALGGLVLEYQTYTVGYFGEHLFWRTIDYFSFFTVDANILVAVVAIAAAIGREVPLAARAMRPSVSGAACLYAVISGATYLLLLRFDHNPRGLEVVADNLVHYIVPPAFLALWVGGLPKGGLNSRTLVRWMMFPAIYFAYTLFRGPRTGFSPYPFIDPNRLGYGGVAINVVALVVGFVGLGAAFVVLDRVLAARQRRIVVN